MVSPYSQFKESGVDLPYPPHHHSKDIDAIKQVIKTNNSLLVLGLSGVGKSSVLRFLVSNPSVQSEEISFVYIDCNGIDWNTKKENIQEEICNRIINQIATQWADIWRLGRARQVLQSLMEEYAKATANHLAIIFDRSEVLQDTLGEAFFNFLRSLRDVNPRLSYVFSGRSLDSEKFGELTDILWNEPHWIGALTIDDAIWTINRHLIRLDIELESEAGDKLLRCVGRHPQLLKYACELLKTGSIDLDDDEVAIVKQLVETPSIKRQCQDLWQDLNPNTQDVLRNRTKARASESTLDIEQLVRCGILDYSDNNHMEFTSPIFEYYVNNLGPPPLTLERGMVLRGSEKVPLSKEEFDLFKVLWDHQPNVVSADQISEAIWPDAQGGVAPQMITNLVKRLRDKIGDRNYINNVHGRGYHFSQGTSSTT